MEPIKMSVSVDVNVDLSQETKNFLTALFTSRIIPCGCAAAEDPTEKEISRIAEAEKEAIASVEKALEEPDTKPAAPSKEEPQPKSTTTIEDVREMLTKKINDHRESIRAKLTEFGAKSVTTLDPAKYSEMYDFLKSL